MKFIEFLKYKFGLIDTLLALCLIIVSTGSILAIFFGPIWVLYGIIVGTGVYLLAAAVNLKGQYKKWKDARNEIC